MRYQRLLGLIMTLGLGAMGAAACASTSGGGTGGTGTGGGGTGGAASALKWYTTCGAPVCMTSDAGAADAGGPGACTTQKEGDACTTAGATCDPGLGCQVQLSCASADPKLQGCPKSRARYKKEIDYVGDARLESLHDELMTMRLATWRYTTEDGTARQHLGFIIDDNPQSVSVDATGDRVDLYGYTSMAVAAAQVEHRRLEALEREIAALRGEIAALKRAATR